MCWRCGTQVIKRDLEQWFFRTTAYADEMLSYDEHRLARSDPRRCRPTGSAGRRAPRSSSTVAADEQSAGGQEIRVFTTRPDTLFGATFMVLAPEHPLVEELTHPDQKDEVDAYRYEARRKSEIDRLSTDREKTGVPLGAHAINPINGERIPIWIADYVLLGYGTGAIMAVPAHDERDFEFARQFGLPVRQVVAPTGDDRRTTVADTDRPTSATPADEVLVNSGDYTNMLAVEGGRAHHRGAGEAGQGQTAP